MRQLTTKLKSGNIKIVETPFPIVQSGQILVKNHYSLVSAGTESSTITSARKGYLGKAKERPQQFKQTMEILRNQGPVQTYRTVMKKLDSYSPLGNSCAGEVIELGSGVSTFKIGDLVACGGFEASHAEVVAVPKNLCVKLKPDSDLKLAAYNTIGAIALQGIRVSELRLGETCAVIGLGLIGQLTSSLLRASGIQIIGIDIDQNKVDIAKRSCVDLALNRRDYGIEERISAFTEGFGCDAVIITAASDSLDPINFAGAILRKRGIIVVVGDIPTGFNREPHFYKKELQVRMSCSYGPGRYDPVYEEKGRDYSPAYVRWTENRNMQAFQELIYNKKIDVSYLTTHTFKLKEAPSAYDMILAKSEPYLGILIEYDVSKKNGFESRKISIKRPVSAGQPSIVCIGFIGAGSYAQSFLLPNIPKTNSISLKGVATTKGASSRSVAERFGFKFCTTNSKDVFANTDINTVFIATRHDTHAHFTIEAIKNGKNVFVEKPLCLNIEELENIRKYYERSDPNKKLLMVGYNRRFSVLTQMIKNKFAASPMAMIYRINAGVVAVDSWIQDIKVGGGRIIGEICHFIDFLTYINGSSPESVYAISMKDPNSLNDTLSVSLSYQNGSIATILYCANGNNRLPKEYVEVYANGCTAILDDFKVLKIYANNKKQVKKLLTQDKGQKNEIKQFLNAVLNGESELIPFHEIYSTSLATFKIIESIRCGSCLKL